jgi:hypothetical protein
LEHLVRVGQHDAVELAVIRHLEQAAVRSLGHLDDSLLDVVELCNDGRIVARHVVDTLEDLERFVFLALHDEPSRTFW